VSTNFEWNFQKAESNLQKHAIRFEEAATIFDDPLHITLLDEEHSQDEDRFITIGYSNQNRLLLVAHAEKEQRVRIISARKVTNHEKKFYDEAQ